MDEKDIVIVGNEIVFTTVKSKPNNPLNRPKMNYKSFWFSFVAYILLLYSTIIISSTLFPKNVFLICIIFSLIYFSIIGKKAAIWLVHLYQNKAKDKTRLKCVFEPSCSEYMILAINKYGLIFGVYKGIKRLLRCHYPNGGIDLP